MFLEVRVLKSNRNIHTDDPVSSDWNHSKGTKPDATVRGRAHRKGVTSKQVIKEWGGAWNAGIWAQVNQRGSREGLSLHS